MSELVRDMTDGPLCPNGIADPIHPSHVLRNRVLDAFYEAADKGDDGEMPEPVERAYGAAAYGDRTADRMDLFRHSTTVTPGGISVNVQAWWYRCRICGLVLSAQVVAR